MENTAPRRGPERDGHFQRSERQITFHAITDGPADHAPGVQVQDHRQIEPALPGPDVADVTRPFLIGLISSEIALQQVRRDVERVVAVCLGFEFTCSFNDNPILTHQPTNTLVPHFDPNFLQFFGHARAAITAKAQARLLLDVGQSVFKPSGITWRLGKRDQKKV